MVIFRCRYPPSSKLTLEDPRIYWTSCRHDLRHLPRVGSIAGDMDSKVQEYVLARDHTRTGGDLLDRRSKTPIDVKRAERTGFVPPPVWPVLPVLTLTLSNSLSTLLSLTPLSSEVTVLLSENFSGRSHRDLFSRDCASVAQVRRTQQPVRCSGQRSYVWGGTVACRKATHGTWKAVPYALR